jgi:hypothetical protein
MQVRPLPGRCVGPRLRQVGLVLGGAGLALVLAGAPAPAARAAGSLATPHPFARQTAAGNQFVQVAALSTTGRADGATSAGGAPLCCINGVDMKLQHASSIPTPGDPTASYSYAIGAYTTSGYWLQMGYLVLGSDSAGLARWFVQVLNPNGSLKTWTTSRPGAANPPPACSACSGGSTDGYPFAFTSDAGGNWTFWFDGLRRTQVRLSAADATIDTARGVFFTAEYTASIVAPDTALLPQRTALRTLSLWSNRTQSWGEAKSATATAYASATGAPAPCPPNGVAPPPPPATGLYPAGNYPGSAHETVAGNGAGCTAPGAVLWAN